MGAWGRWHRVIGAFGSGGASGVGRRHQLGVGGSLEHGAGKTATGGEGQQTQATLIRQNAGAKDKRQPTSTHCRQGGVDDAPKLCELDEISSWTT